MCHTPLWRTSLVLPLSLALALALTLALPARASASNLLALNSGVKGGTVSFARKNSSEIRAANGDAVGGTVGLGDVNDLCVCFLRVPSRSSPV